MRWTETANRRQARGFTLVEVLVVVAIVALLVGVLVGVTGYIDSKKNAALTENCLTILKTAVTEYRDITGHYPIDHWDDQLDLGSRLAGAVLADDNFEPKSDELLYLQLNLLPQTREIIAKLPGQLLAKPESSAVVLVAGRESRYLRSILDGWENPISYQLDPDTVFPDIWSDGPDGPDGGTGDDIVAD